MEQQGEEYKQVCKKRRSNGREKLNMDKRVADRKDPAVAKGINPKGKKSKNGV